ncbi:cytochrome bd-I ubiquinol oxidase subunit 1 apoprotein [Methylobacillus rhizosphaerae]|uniref:Cytochrome bd-I ubiquinol oxidase subunit 1 apoprotein n=1 Tax=Methylobacillus rhizosphaerae TaxID=551994 RepID=A0A238YUR2_9PROT|nr:cytochrome ubiquinol oxidase subunit I [Methylobacillus rhizosphaerae]SNR75026.1 cytochrome bd-I ubiquinol oxidase subunit 1 apoprotein [Methylobacillus rhizosphaerae]
MPDFSALDLARIQFAFTVSFHIIFPSITIGLASYLFVLEALWLKTSKDVYKDLYHYWLKIFGVNFGMGVVSGLVMAYQFGTNWSGFSTFSGSITGPLLTYEVLTAFFLEAGFLGVMMFGWSRVGPGLHLLSTAMVALGTLISATWILASNSWMQTPQGFEIANGVAVPTDWWQIIFNPSFPYRLLHMSVAAFLATALMVGAAGAWHLLRKQNSIGVRTMLSMAMWMLLIVAPIQAVIGDFHGLNTLKHQPAKIAAIEGHWQNHDGKAVPLLLFGLPDMKEEKTHFSVGVPHLGSLILTHTWDGQIPALKDFPAEDRPNASIIFWSFRIMVGLGLLMIALGIWSLWLRYQQLLFSHKGFLRFALCMGPTGVIAILAGWFTTEVGRQPWVVYGIMRTADAVSNHDIASLAASLALFVVVYLFVFGVGIGYLLHLMRLPVPHSVHEPDGGPGQARQPMRPLSTPDEPFSLTTPLSNAKE